MKKIILPACAACLAVGVLAGTLLPVPWGPMPPPPAVLTPAVSESSPLSHMEETLDPQANFPLLNTACQVVRALKRQDYLCLASLVHPELGVTFTPGSTVDFDTDLKLSPDQLRDAPGDDTLYAWGSDQRGELIRLTIPDYLTAYVFDADYTQAPHIAIDRIVLSGNALENVAEAYPGCRFVDFCFPGQDQTAQGLDWSSLKLVFTPSETEWLLVGVIHSQWTV